MESDTVFFVFVLTLMICYWVTDKAVGDTGPDPWVGKLFLAMVLQAGLLDLVNWALS